MQRHRESASTEAQKIEEIERLHRDDGEVLFRLGELEAYRGVREDAESMLDRAIELGYREAAAYLERAAIRANAGDVEGALADARAALEQSGVPPHLVMRAVRMVRELEGDKVTELPAVTGLDVPELMMLASNLNRVGDVEQSDAILRRIASDGEQSDERREGARSNLALNCIGSGRYREAMETITSGGRGVEEMGIGEAFNYGMAAWADSGIIETRPFERVVSLDADGEGREKGANYLQCLAVANWATGDREGALRFANQARDIGRVSRLVFSCWQYKYVSGSEFAKDTDEILALVGGDEKRLPAFMVRSERER